MAPRRLCTSAGRNLVVDEVAVHLGHDGVLAGLVGGHAVHEAGRLHGFAAGKQRPRIARTGVHRGRVGIVARRHRALDAVVVGLHGGLHQQGRQALLRRTARVVLGKQREAVDAVEVERRCARHGLAEELLTRCPARGGEFALGPIAHHHHRGFAALQLLQRGRPGPFGHRRRGPALEGAQALQGFQTGAGRPPRGARVAQTVRGAGPGRHWPGPGLRTVWPLARVRCSGPAA
jgi:hypothetical protein